MRRFGNARYQISRSSLLRASGSLGVRRVERLSALREAPVTICCGHRRQRFARRYDLPLARCQLMVSEQETIDDGS